MAASYRGKYTPGLIEVPTTSTLRLGGSAVTATGAELSLLDADNTEPADAPWAAVSRWAKVEYDFATDGGTVGEKALGVSLPDNALVLSCIVEKVTVFASSGSATVALHAEGAGDILAATAFDNAQYTVDVAPAAALAASKFKTTASREIKLTIATAALTAGKYNFHIEYLIGE